MKRLARLLRLMPNEQRVVIAIILIIVAVAAYLRHERKLEEQLPAPPWEQISPSPSPAG